MHNDVSRNVDKYLVEKRTFIKQIKKNRDLKLPVAPSQLRSVAAATDAANHFP